MALGIQPRTHQVDKRISSHKQQQGDANQRRTDQGVDGGEDMGTFFAGTTGQGADHGAVERAVNPSQQDQQKAREHIGVVVGVVGRPHAKGSGDGLLAHQASQFAEGRCDRHD